MVSQAKKAIEYAINEIREAEGKIYKFQQDFDASIFGGDEGLDSLNFAFFVVNIEEYVKSEMSIEIVLFDDYVFGLDPQDPKHPFANLKNLIHYVEDKIKSAMT
jgi:acyl carrier protein